MGVGGWGVDSKHFIMMRRNWNILPSPRLEKIQMRLSAKLQDVSDIFDFFFNRAPEIGCRIFLSLFLSFFLSSFSSFSSSI